MAVDFHSREVPNEKCAFPRAQMTQVQEVGYISSKLAIYSPPRAMGRQPTLPNFLGFIR